MKLLFLCSGNTCRSPLAVAAWQALPLAPSHIKAASAGFQARDGEAATRHSIAIARDWGVDLTIHRARTLTPQMLSDHDIVVVMTPQHREFLHRSLGFKKRLELLGAFESEAVPPPFLEEARGSDETISILDPFGGSREAYESCAEQIRRSVEGLARVLQTESEVAP